MDFALIGHTLLKDNRMKFGEKWNLQQNIFSSFFGYFICLIFCQKKKE
jgi:hypothetical protein